MGACAADIAPSPRAQNAPAQTGAPWLSDKWTEDFSLPPGIYRGNRNEIIVEKGRTITVGPECLIEKANFKNIDGNTWNIAGSFFRDVQIMVERGQKITARDTAFEDLNARKGGWYLDRWSTRWWFDNCVFGRKFLEPVLSIMDYSVRAESCTFYEVELPELKYRHDPSDEAQSEDLRFTGCRFVGCTVPESFLASTVNCVFEKCHLSTKREDWSKATKPINVTAYIVGRNNPPADYDNGVLKVAFKTLESAQKGATLNVTNSGGRLTVPGLRVTGEAISIGGNASPRDPASATAASTSPNKPEAAIPQPPASNPGGWAGTSELLKTYRNSLVFVNGTNGAGSGFIASMAGANFLVTNAHVAAGVRGAAFKTLDGAQVKGGAAFVAVGHDIFSMQLAAGGKPFQVMQGVDENASIDDEIVVLGNAEGAGVINPIKGKIVGIGPNLVEVDAAFVPGNSGSPIIHLKSGKVIGVATYLIIKKYDAATKEAIKEPVVRRF